MQIKKQGNFAITAKKLSLAIPKIPYIFLEEKMLWKIDKGLKEMRNSKLNYLNEHIKENNEVIITYFIQDKKMVVNILTK